MKIEFPKEKGVGGVELLARLRDKSEHAGEGRLR